jgi:hypothetical protein
MIGKKANFAVIMNNLRQYYTDRTSALCDAIAVLKRKSHFFIGGEITSFLLVILFIVVYTVEPKVGYPLLAFASLIAYIVIRRIDVSNGEKMEEYGSLLKVCQNEIRYIDGDFSAFDKGERYVNAKHEYSFDLDIFGSNSLYNRIDRTISTGGSDYLAECLSSLPFNDDADGKEKINKRREAVDKLAKMHRLRTDFIAMGQKEKMDTKAILTALNAVRSLQIPHFAFSVTSVVIAWMAIVGFIASILLSVFTPLSGNVPVMWGILQFFIVFMICSKPLRNIGKEVNKLHNQLKTYARLVKLISTTELSDIDDPMFSDAFRTENSDVVKAFVELKDILDGLDRRGNILGLLFFDTLLLSDFFLLRRFVKWQKRFMGRISQWIDDVSTLDALVSMATFRFNEPRSATAEICNDSKIVFEARGLYHPFLGEKAISNDFSIKDMNYYIITGANMAGKSTFLRSLGINYVLAMNGMPVFAKSLKVSMFRLFSSMRTTDDLTHGISYFNAELLRLKQLLDSCESSPRTLIILDEILKGTNSLDKLNGSRLFLKEISRMPVAGVIATHDLELSKMSDEYPERFHNFCFEIELDSDITYTYKITPGVARNQNATFLLRNIIYGKS